MAKKLGYKPKYHEIIEIDVSNLSKWCGSMIEFKCDVCGEIKNVQYSLYILKKTYGSGIDTCSPKCGRAKTDITNMEKYGCISPTQNKEVLKKRENGYMEKYGQITNLLCDDTKIKIKKTMMDKYGVENPSQSSVIKQKKEDVCMERYGVSNPLQDRKIFDRQQINAFKYENVDGFNCRGSYEKDFILNFKDKIKIEKPISLNYMYKDKIKRYHPDFYIPEHNLIVEIKSSYTYNYNVEMNENKKKACLEQGYNFIFIINKNYTEFESIYGL